MFGFAVRAARRVFAELEQLAQDLSEDPQIQAALEAELSLPPGALDDVKPDQRGDALAGIDAYLDSAKPSAEQMKIAFEGMARYVSFWTTLFDAAKTEDPSIVVDEALYRLLQTTSVDVLKFNYPTTYAVMRLVGAIEQDLRLALEESFAPEVPANIFTGGYGRAWQEVFFRNYERFRLDQDIPPLPDDAAPAESLVRRQLGAEMYLLSDVGGVAMYFIANYLGKIDGADVRHYYGWELPPRPPQLIGEDPPKEVVLNPSEHIASRASTLWVGDQDGDGALLTQLLMRDAQNRLGWLLSFRGALTLEQRFGSARPLRFKLQAVADSGLDVIVPLRGGGGVKLPGALGGVLHLELAPETSSHQGPALTIPQATGSRFEIGEFSVKGSITKEGVAFRGELRKGALVIVGNEGDGLTGEALPGGETRIEFEFAVLLDEHGLRVEGGGRLGATFALNKSFGRVRVQTIAVQVHPGSTPTGSEFRFEASAGMDFDLGPVKVSMDGIGATLGLGVARELPPGGRPLLGSLVHLTELGFQAPKGVGISVASRVVNGGGYLFRDDETGTYGGALQLSIGKRLTLTAVGLLNTRLPDGSKAFSLLLIASLEFMPSIPLFAGIGLRGVGLLGGIHRTVNVDALRSGLRNKTLDAILFPRDPIANAPQIVSALKAVFPPARDRHLFGLMVSLTFLRSVITAELGVIYEFGAKRWVMLGQIKALYPAKPPTGLGERLLEMNVDAVGVWDPEREEFSLDATLYDSRIAFVSFSGDVAVRVRKGETFLFSAGGYHPEFAVPPGFPRLQRVKISLADSKHLKLLLTGYVAITSNTRQIGARMEFFAEFGGFSIEAVLGFDALWEPDVRFLIDFDLEFKLKYKGVTFFGVDVSGRFSGPEPKRVKGEWSIDLWLTSISKKFDKTFGPERPPVALPAVDPLPPLVAALTDPLNWTAEPPGVTLVSFRTREAQFVHPLGRLAVRQQVLPLGIRLDRFGGTELPGAQRFDITSATVGGRAVTSRPPLSEAFAAAEYLNLSDDEKLARPSFDYMAAGVALSPSGVAFGPAVDSPLRYDEKLFGAAGGPPVSKPPAPVQGPLVLVAAEFAAPARSRLQDRHTVAGPDLQVGAQRFVLARTEDLAVVGPATTSYTAALQAAQPGQQVVFHAEATS